MSYKDITIKMFLQIQDIIKDDETPDSEKEILIANAIYGTDITELPIIEYKKKMIDLKFLNEKPKDEKLASNYTINGTKYKSSADLASIQANQFIDFQNYAKKEDMIGCISCFFIPEGHKYNDGYDMLKVKEDVGDLPITTGNALAFFFKSQYVTLLVLSQRASLKKMKEVGMNKKKLKEMQEALATLGIANLASTLSY